MQTCASGVGDLLDGNDVAGARRLRDQRPEPLRLMWILVEVACVAGRHGLEIIRALLLFEPEPRRVVEEDPSRRAQLGDHVGDRAPLGVAQRGHAGTGELEEGTPSAAHALLPQQLEDDVLGLNPRALQLALEENADELRARQLERVACHAHGDIEPAGAHRDHRAGPRLGRMAVSSDEGLAWLREAPLAMDLGRSRYRGAGTRRRTWPTWTGETDGRPGS